LVLDPSASSLVIVLPLFLLRVLCDLCGQMNLFLSDLAAFSAVGLFPWIGAQPEDLACVC
jgi:hypothetical protein